MGEGCPRFNELVQKKNLEIRLCYLYMVKQNKSGHPNITSEFGLPDWLPRTDFPSKLKKKGPTLNPEEEKREICAHLKQLKRVYDALNFASGGHV
ncbi:uncharacterized protein LOC127288297 isoform X3 [Leptopilina boulardi]|uniref:uncharacterized protein LOC127288297 isoform X3 n=1 Tax=Leptopilina boulardi TaxID=63433 RepID=UPI0021F60BD5|nr:uncharacterized protein LOC127288297 isoform X3 [Leptopilina boulardi]XP_051171633.1 uncharacterized protein LOC127288297 isoform X3 [Leptopilina boulardi]